MKPTTKGWRSAWLLPPIAILTLAMPSLAFAQIEANLDRYTGANAKGYLNPLKEGFGAALQAGMYRSAAIPSVGIQINLEMKAGFVKFGDADRTFTATAESDFVGATRQAQAPTVVGDGEAVTLTGDGGASFVFPGGLDIGSLGVPMPQLTVGGIMGSQVLFRWIGFDTGDSEIGKINLFGIGVRHSVSQYIPMSPVDVAAGVTWQKFQLGDDLIDASALSFGVQASKGYSILEPYVVLALDTFDMSVDYDYTSGGTTVPFHVDFDRSTDIHLAGGLGVNLGFFHLFGEVGTAGRMVLSTGFSLGN